MTTALDVKEIRALDEIVARACARHASLRGFASPAHLDGLRLKLDIMAVQAGPDPLDLHKLAKADMGTLVRVVYGILEHVDRDSGRLPPDLITDRRFRKVATDAHPSCSIRRAAA